jgi:SAM-dependent methyltransferase
LALGDGMTTLPLASVYTQALQGHPCTVREGDLEPRPLPTRNWLAEAGESDRALLRHCQGPTVDIGCGPGRMSEALALSGHAVLGIDVVPEAVRQTRSRGVAALRRSVFDSVPGEGRWETALLADGNVGIGGDPVALLERVRELVASDGRVVVDLAPWGTGVVTRHVRLETPQGRSKQFPWTTVGADAIQAVAHAAGFGPTTQHRYGDRWWAVVRPLVGSRS